MPWLVTVLILTLALGGCGGSDDKDGGLLRRGGTGAAETIAAGSSARATPTPAGTAARTTPAATSSTPAADNANREDWQVAMLDSSSRLPGEYIAPHPGADGRVCDTRACVTTNDDRNHVSGTIPICTQAQLSARNYSTPLCYHSNPPTSGPHASTFATPRVLDTPATKESLVHSMEHGDVIIWYNTDDQNAIRTLAQITNGANSSGKLVVMSRYEGMEANTIALTAWTRLDKFSVSQLRDQRVLDFVNAHSRRFNPEGF